MNQKDAVKKNLKRIALFALVVFSSYFVTALSCTYITVGETIQNAPHQIFLNSNDIHIDIVIHKSDLPKEFLKSIRHFPEDNYLSFGWGDKDFYLNTPTWGDLSLYSALKALFWKSESLMHVTRYYRKSKTWTAVSVSKQQLQKIIDYIDRSFVVQNDLTKKRLKHPGYHSYDDFYYGIGSYSCFFTCNTWANNALKNSGVRACLWTPFEFRLMDIHQQN